MSADEFKGQIDTNFWGVVNVTQAILPHLRQQGRGHIIQITSIAGRWARSGKRMLRCLLERMGLVHNPYIAQDWGYHPSQGHSLLKRFLKHRKFQLKYEEVRQAYGHGRGP